MWIPIILENDIDPNYSECLCPKCGETTVHHMGAPCEDSSCPKCGEMMERRGAHDIEVKESKVVKLPDGSGFFTGTVGKKKKVKEELIQSEKPRIKKTASGHILPKSPPVFGSAIPSPMASLGERELVNIYLNYIQDEGVLDTLKSVGQTAVKRVSQSARKIKKSWNAPGGRDTGVELWRAVSAARPGQKVNWPSRTGQQIAGAIK